MSRRTASQNAPLKCVRPDHRTKIEFFIWPTKPMALFKLAVKSTGYEMRW